MKLLVSTAVAALAWVALTFLWRDSGFIFEYQVPLTILLAALTASILLSLWRE